MRGEADGFEEDGVDVGEGDGGRGEPERHGEVVEVTEDFWYAGGGGSGGGCWNAVRIWGCWKHGLSCCWEGWMSANG